MARPRRKEFTAYEVEASHVLKKVGPNGQYHENAKSKPKTGELVPHVVGSVWGNTATISDWAMYGPDTFRMVALLLPALTKERATGLHRAVQLIQHTVVLHERVA